MKELLVFTKSIYDTVLVDDQKLNQMVTKEELHAEMDRIDGRLDQMATKEDLHQLDSRFDQMDKKLDKLLKK